MLRDAPPQPVAGMLRCPRCKAVLAPVLVGPDRMTYLALSDQVRVSQAVLTCQCGGGRSFKTRLVLEPPISALAG